MNVEFKLPDIGEGVAEGEIVRWIVNEGDAIREDQPMVEIMTDKATVEIGSPVNGRVAKILAKAGTTVPVHSVIVELEKAGAASATSAAPAAHAAAHAAPQAAAASAAATQSAAHATPAAHSDSKVLAAPATRRLARESGIDLGAVAGSGPHGRVTKDDVMAHMTGPTPSPAGKLPALHGGAPAGKLPALPRARTFTPGGEERIAYRGIRKATGDQMVRSAYTAPHFTYVDEIDMSALFALRKEAAKLADEQGIKLTFLPFIIKALCSALRRHPTANATLDEKAGEIIVKHDIHVGIATDTERGLMVPVLKHAHAKNALELAAELQALTAKARAGQASRDELTGSTITITSAGSIGGLFATPIINFPEVAILGVYQIKDKPVIRDGAVVPGKIGYLSITLDHRVVDGGTAAHMMNHIKRLLENPALFALEG